jgi:hypothetical protein
VVVTVKDQNVANIDLVYDQTVVTLSGTVNVTMNGGSVPQGDVSVYACRNADYSDYVAGATVHLQDNTWSMRLLPLDTETPLYFEISIYSPGGGNRVREGTGISVVVKDQSIDNINLGAVDLSAVILSGTVAITIDGEPLVTEQPITVKVYRDAAYSDHVTDARVNRFQGYTWSVILDSFDDDTPLYFTVCFYTNWGELERGTGVYVTAKNQIIDNINLVYNLALVTLSGTVNVTVNGSTPNGNVGVWAYRDTEYSSSVGGAGVNLQDNTWSMRFLPFDTETTLYFAIHFFDDNSHSSVEKGTGIPITVHDQSIHNIDLGSVNFNVITLSGTVEVTVNGVTLNYIPSLRAYRNADYSGNYIRANINSWEGNTWSMIFESSDTDTTLYFMVEINPGSPVRGTGVSVTVRDQDISGIAIVGDFTD